MSLLWLFILLTTLNVIIGTIKSIATIKGSKLTAAIINALAIFGIIYVIMPTLRLNHTRQYGVYTDIV